MSAGGSKGLLLLAGDGGRSGGAALWEADSIPNRVFCCSIIRLMLDPGVCRARDALSNPLQQGGGGAAPPPLLSEPLPLLASSVERAAIHLRLSPSSCPDYYDHYCLISSCKSEILCLIFFLPGECITRGEIGSEVQRCSVEKLPQQIETVSLFRRSFDWNQSFFFL